ncbi:o-acyltransferase [Anaeramoeba ignava]|uniref:O-acyltransferase n=1 Tax=Anaeramoeba ignava TaxID=1746090 RepID=A0A9Q0L674_ANAIG|nr:o-acyltransferase [Anaeramoeba ignava]
MRFFSAFNPIRNIKSIFTRPTRNHIQAFDGIRALSSYWILAYHIIIALFFISEHGHVQKILPNPILRVIFMGDSAVDIFFIVSGFLVYSRFLSELKGNSIQNLNLTIRLKYFANFLIRRFFRLYPLIYFFILLKILELVSVNNLKSGIPQILITIFFLNDMIPANEYTPVPHSWSVATEMKTYVILLYIKNRMMKTGKDSTKLLIKIFVIAFIVYLTGAIFAPNFYKHPFYTEVWREDSCTLFRFDPETKNFVLSDPEPHLRDNLRWLLLYFGFHSRFPLILIGCFAALIQYRTSFPEKCQKSKSFRLITLLIGLILFSSLFILRHTNYMLNLQIENISIIQQIIIRFFSLNRIINSIGASLLILLIINKAGIFGKFVNYFLSLKIWVPFSNLSYSLYLTQLVPIFLLEMDFIKKFGFDWIDITSCFVLLIKTTLITYPIAIIIFLLIEKPMINLSPERFKFDQLISEKEKEKKKED